MSAPVIGDRVRFAPNPRWPDRLAEADVVGQRDTRSQLSRLRQDGWLETIDDVGFRRSVRPSRCTVIVAAERPTGARPAGSPNPIAAADPAAAASQARPDGDLRPGRSTSLDRGA